MCSDRLRARGHSKDRTKRLLVFASDPRGGVGHHRPYPATNPTPHQACY
jgi:hypothetical protein